MTASAFLPLTHSWPLYDAARHMPMAWPDAPDRTAMQDAVLATPDIGLWQCDLRDERLDWTDAVYRLFGLPDGERLERRLIVSLYEERSRVAMEALRAHAIRHHRGFTLDARIRRPDGAWRWMRLTAMPVLSGRKVVRLRGAKQDVTAAYDGPGAD